MESREIKFRAWHKRSKMWIIAEVFLDIINGKFLCGTEQEMYGSSMWELDDYEDLIDVQQYTGLKDKNGKEIYEGDIVKVYEWTALICFHEGRFGYKFSNMLDEEYLADQKIGIDCWRGIVEVIGNIYENKELLK